MGGKTCFDCGLRYPVGPEPFQIDEWLCRECQRSPAIQARVLLGRARHLGFDFERAWLFALGTAPSFSDGRVRWPHDTDHRREWKAVFAMRDTREAWRAAYCKEPQRATETPISMLVAA